MKKSAGEGSLWRGPKLKVVVLRGQVSFLYSAPRPHPACHHHIITPSFFRSPREKGRRGSGSVGRGGKLLLGGRRSWTGRTER